jgi:alpha-ketoglutarate-dependent taurine dioxygenase
MRQMTRCHKWHKCDIVLWDSRRTVHSAAASYSAGRPAHPLAHDDHAVSAGTGDTGRDGGAGQE